MKRLRPRRILLGALTALSATLAGCDFIDSDGPPPSIVLIMVDTLRADYLGAYGFDGPISPSLDRLAAESVVFRNCFSQAPWTKPSIASLFTSLYVPVHGVRSHSGRFATKRPRSNAQKEEQAASETETLADEAVTLAEALRAGGYATGAFVANPWIRAGHGFGQGFDTFDAKRARNGVTAEVPFASALEWLAGVPKDKPFFVYVHLMDVHGPYEAPEEDFEAVRNSPSLGAGAALSSRHFRRMPAYLKRSEWFAHDSTTTRGVRGRYAAGIRAFDRRLNAFLKSLRDDGVLDDAVIVVTADHGEQLFEHRGWDHGNSLYDEELHVPLIIRLPRAGNAGREVSAVVSLIDVMPTLLKLARAPAVQGMQGRDLIPLLDGEDADSDGVGTFATAVKWKPGKHSARTGSHKLIADIHADKAELYDLRNDAGESHDLAADSPALGPMEDMLAAHFAENAQREGLEPGVTEMPADVRERLRALGYEE